MKPWDPALLARVEDAGLNASAPTQQRWFDGWMLRFSPGKAKRARCVNALAAGRLPLADKLAQVQALYDQAGLPMVLRITPFTAPPGLEAELEDLGLGVLDDTRVMLADLQQATLDAGLPASGQLEPVAAADFAEVVGALRGSPPGQRLAQARRMAHSPVPLSAWQLRIDGRVVACGHYALEGELVGLYDIFTAPELRGRGLARHLCTRLLRQASGQGARFAYLQVEADNAPARAIYHRLGFADGYAYHYRTTDPAAA